MSYTCLSFFSEPRHQRKPNIFYSGPASPARPRYRLSSGGPRSPYCKRMNRFGSEIVIDYDNINVAVLR